jgi:hypothetical protein
MMDNRKDKTENEHHQRLKKTQISQIPNETPHNPVVPEVGTKGRTPL